MTLKIMSKGKLAAQIQRLTGVSIITLSGAISSVGVYAQEVPPPPLPSSTEDSAVETVIITGVKKSIEDATSVKRKASQIVDAISAEDIGQLPDKNIAEAMQRITGVQIGRDETGAGSGFQVRGLSENRVEINGQTMTGNADSGANSLSNIDSALYSGVEVVKSPMANMVEGGLGATVRLKSFQALDRKPFVNINVEGNKSSIAEDGGGKASLAASTVGNFDSIGKVGFLLNLSQEIKSVQTDAIETTWASPTIANLSQISGNSFLSGGLDPLPKATTQSPFTVFMPTSINYKSETVNFDTKSIDTNFQWRLNDDFELKLSAQHVESEKENRRSKLGIKTAGGAITLLDADIAATDLNETPVILGPFSRSPTADEHYISNKGAIDPATGLAAAPVYEPYPTEVKRYIVQSGTFRAGASPAGGNGNPPWNPNYEVTLNEIETNIGTLEIKYSPTENVLLKSVISTNEQITKSQLMGMAMLPVDSVLTSIETYFDYSPDLDFPVAGGLSQDGTFQQADGSKLLTDKSKYLFEKFTGNQSVYNEKNTSFTFDFEWTIDDSFITKFETGYRYAVQSINRQRVSLTEGGLQTTGKSITSDNWRLYDRNVDNPQLNRNFDSIACQNVGCPLDQIDEAFNDLYGVNSPLGGLVVTTKPLFEDTENSKSLIPQWVTLDADIDQMKGFYQSMFPGRSGDCEISLKDSCNAELATWTQLPESGIANVKLNSQGEQVNKEFDAVLTMPKASFVTSKTFPYLIDMETNAVYGMTNFETEIADIPIDGNLGLRYVQTITDSVGIELYRAVNLVDGSFVPAVNYDKAIITHIEPIYVTNKYSNLLPSGNMVMKFSDDMFLRFAAAKNISRPNTKYLMPSRVPGGVTLDSEPGNPNLKPQESTSYDISWEWYMSGTSSMSVALFKKDLRNFLIKQTYSIQSDSDVNFDGEFDPVAVTRRVNGGKGTIQGIELGATYTFDKLPNFWNGFGVQTNYTFTDSAQDSGINQLDGSALPVADLSKNSYNLVLFYDKYGFNFRAAYNYRDESFDSFVGSTNSVDPRVYIKNVDGSISAETVQLPIWNDAFSTLDLSTSYKYGDFKVFFQVRNVLNAPTRKYVGDKETTKFLLSNYTDTGTAYVLGASYRF